MNNNHFECKNVKNSNFYISNIRNLITYNLKKVTDVTVEKKVLLSSVIFKFLFR